MKDSSTSASSLNDQIQDSVDQVQDAVNGMGVSEGQSQAIAEQIVTQAIGLAMQNAVAQQQQTYVLRNAVTSAAAKAILESSPAEAIQFAKDALAGDDVVATLSDLKDLMDAVHRKSAGTQPDEDGLKKEPPKRSRKRS